MILSILIPVIPEHEKQFNTLYGHLSAQLKDNVEIIPKHSPTFLAGGMSTGKKRQWLLEQATGKYIVFIDADDLVPNYYIEEMLKACNSDCDCFAINGIMTTDGRDELKWRISKDYINPGVFNPFTNRVVQDNYKENGKHVYLRRTNHITGVKREIALAAGFPDKSNAEDKHYSDRLVLNSEYKIERPMYTYRFSTKNKSYR